MQRGHRLTHPAALDMPQGFDPCGIPCVDSDLAQSPETPSETRHARSLPGLPARSLIASVEEVVPQECGDWLAWGSVGDRPVLFTLEPAFAADVKNAVAAGEMATAIIEPWQLVVERLD